MLSASPTGSVSNVATSAAIVFDGDTFTITPRGPFSLRESALFGFGQRHVDVFDGTMRLAFCVDGLRAQAAVAVSQTPDGRVHATICGVQGPALREQIAAQTLRVLSLDHDARPFVALGERDPVLRKLLAAAPGLRPPLFYSPYEAALWAVLSARRPFRAAQTYRQRLSEQAGNAFEVAGQRLNAVPLPERLLELGVAGIQALAGIEAQRAVRVHAVAAALQGDPLSAATLTSLDPAEARKRLRALPGIGAFYADLILVRASGATDVLPLNEPLLFGLLETLYGVNDAAEVIARMGSTWRPFRTWVAVLVRAVGPRVLVNGADFVLGAARARGARGGWQRRGAGIA